MIIGYSNGFHDSGMAVIDNGNILYAGHAERYSRIKNDKNHSLLMPQYDGKTVFYEKPFLKNTRRKFAGQRWKSRPKYDKYVSHHWSHAAASYYTKPFTNEPVCVIVDAIGEWDTISIWYKKKKVWSRKYPYSLGLFYSAVTKACGLKPMEDEYITMGMAAYGEPVHALDYLLETKQTQRLEFLRRCFYFKLEQPLNENEALQWDKEILHKEQYIWADSIINTIDLKTEQKIERILQGKFLYSLLVPKEIRFTGNLSNKEDRYNYALNKLRSYCKTNYN